MAFKLSVGSKAQVMNGTAKCTSGRLEKKDLMRNKHGRIVSKKQHQNGKKSLKFLTRAGYKTKKGVFGTKKNRSQRRR